MGTIEKRPGPEQANGCKNGVEGSLKTALARNPPKGLCLYSEPHATIGT
jgi:hypothetical protein